MGFAAEPAKADLAGLLQKGLYEEEVNRNFEAAILEYRAALAQFDRQRNHGATALFRLAECLRKTGRKAEADALYRRVIQEFPDQANLVQLSHAHLGTTPGAAKAEGVPPASVLGEEANEIQRIAAMIKNSPDLINAPRFGAAPLQLAAAKAQLRVAAYLLDHGADIECKLGADNAVTGAKAGSTPLILAAQAGHKAMVELLVKRGASVEAVDNDRKTALHWAAENGYKSVAEVLLEAKASLDAADNRKDTPLILAIGKGHKVMVELLLVSGADVNFANQSGQTALQVAARQGREDLVKRLLAAKADIHARDIEGKTPLHLAAAANHGAVITVLCEAGARVNEADHSGFTPLMRALQYGEEAVDLLLRYKADPQARLPGTMNNMQKPTVFMMAAVSARPEVVQRLLDQGADIHARDDHGMTALLSLLDPRGGQYARMTNILGILLRQGADVRAASSHYNIGWTALHFAAYQGYTEVAGWLLDRKAGVNAQDKFGRTPLHIAVFNGNLETAELLLQRGADAHLHDYNGRTPLEAVLGVSTLPPTAQLYAQPGAFVPVRGSADALRDLLLKHGASLVKPRPGFLVVGRSSSNVASWTIPAHTNGWNQLTLMEAIYANPRWLPFPDWDKVRILRRQADGKIQTISVNVENILRGSSKDIPLTWSDAVEIPEKEHLAGETCPGWGEYREIIEKMLERRVTIHAQSLSLEKQTNAAPKFRWSPYETRTTTCPVSGRFAWLTHCLISQRNAYFASSDLARVTVRRTDPATGKVVEYVVDASKPLDSRADLWLREGDVIEIPQKAGATPNTPQAKP